MEERGGAERLLDLAYGNHPKSSSLKPEALKVMRSLREGAKSIDELAAVLGLDLKTPGGRKHFYVLMKPLRETGMIATRKAGGKTVYYLSYDGFSQFLRDIRKEAEYWLVPETHQG
ncbi:MAG: helix-turn-helix domain-containing protein [Candidatus Hadarchaeum sp.]|uniref:helix-turn-helix domain-containing protein n=1 Tax=Candidatus Hadarchaeum sp. TaxID=2883567 RepID=UPI003D0FE3CF